MAPIIILGLREERLVVAVTVKVSIYGHELLKLPFICHIHGRDQWGSIAIFY